MESTWRTTIRWQRTLRLVIGLVMAGTMTACSQPNSWSKPGMNEVTFDGDLAQCRHQATAATQSMQVGEGNGLERSDRQDRLVRRCMEAKGYTLTGQ